MPWRWASASVIGTSHIQNGGQLEDAYIVKKLDNGGMFAVVSDGAGSAKYGAAGAWIVCCFLSIRSYDWFRENTELPTNDELSKWIDELRKLISGIAIRRGVVSRQFASTLAAVLATPDKIVTIHVGDSAVVGRKSDNWEVFSWPENGEYASSTYFVTDEPKPRLNIIRNPSDYDAFVLFSDGVGDLALSEQDKTAYRGFFEPIMRPIDATSEKGHLDVLSKKLATFLESPSVCARSDDDKTLILISRR